MKQIFHVITTINRGGAEIQLLVLARQQVLAGYKVDIAYLKGSPELKESFELAGAQVHQFLVDRNPACQVYSLRKFLKDKQVIIHAHLPRAQLISVFGGGGKVIVSSRHDSEPFFHGAPNWFSRFLAKIVDFRSAQQIAISSAVKTAMINRKEVTKTNTLEVVHYGFESFTELEPINPFPDDFYSLDNDTIVVGTVGRLVEQKDYPTLLAGFARFQKLVPKSVLTIAGAGPLEMKLKQLAKELGISGKVFWLGEIRSLGNYYSQIDVFVLASKTEGFGLVLLEAMSAGKPIVASNATSIPEVIGPRNGIFFESGNFEELKCALLEMFKGDNLRVYSDLSSRRILDFNPRQMSDKVTRVYEKALSR